VPAQAVLDQGTLGEPPGAKGKHAGDLGVQVGRAQVQVHPVLGTLGLRYPLQQYLDARPVRREQRPVGASRLTVPDVAEHGGPEPGCALGVGAVDDDHELTVPVKMRLAFHDTMLPVPTPQFILDLREKVGHDPLWLTAAMGVVLDGRGRVLLQRRSDTGRWALPGGIVEPGEEPADAAVREIYEETGVIAVPEALTSVSISAPITYPNGDHVRYLDLTFRCRPVGGRAQVNDTESAEVGWHTLGKLPELSDYAISPLSEAVADRAETAFTFSGLDEVLGDVIGEVPGGVPGEW
jgi:8-oxo-dGTP pyrophosphatase MutT (NUDIX family)